MEHKLAKILNNAKYEPSPSLEVDVWTAIVARNKLITRIKLSLFSLIGTISLVSLIPAVKILLNDLSTSGIFDYISVAFSSLFSSNGSILSFWKELSLSIIESIPVVSIALSMTLLFVLFLSMKHIMRQINRNQLSISF